jgi:GTP-binding protein
VDDYETVEREIRAYSPELAARPRLVAGNKAELPGAGARGERLARYCADRGTPCRVISAMTGLGLADLVNDLGARLGAEQWQTAGR